MVYKAAVEEPYSFLYIYLNPRDRMFHVRFERTTQTLTVAALKAAALYIVVQIGIGSYLQVVVVFEA